MNGALASTSVIGRHQRRPQPNEGQRCSSAKWLMCQLVNGDFEFRLTSKKPPYIYCKYRLGLQCSVRHLPNSDGLERMKGKRDIVDVGDGDWQW